MSSSSSNEVDTFNNLCDGVLTAHSMFDMCLTEVDIYISLYMVSRNAAASPWDRMGSCPTFLLIDI